MIVTIHQPDFLPWLGFFDRWRNSDIYIVLDDVQFLRRGWHHRDRIKTAAGPAWLTVPVCKKGRYDQLIRDVAIDDSINWRENHLKTLEFNYRKGPGFERCFNKISEIYNKGQKYLMDFNMDLLRFVATELKISKPVLFASSFNIRSSATTRLVELVKSVCGTVYLTGTGSKDYLDETIFKKENIEVLWHQYEHPIYDQLFGKFVPKLSVIDYLMMRDEAKAPTITAHVNN